MSYFHDVSFGFGRKLPLILQTEATECGLACIAMVAGYYEYRADLTSLRRRFNISLKGTTLGHLIKISEHLSLNSRALRLELEDLSQLRLPCIIHWNFNHFVVLKKVTARSITIHDPSFGSRKLSLDEASKSFTGVALELWPNAAFIKQKQAPAVKLQQLVGKVTGLRHSIIQVLLLALSLEVFVLVSPFFLQWSIDNAILSGDLDLLTTLAAGFGGMVLIQQVVSAIRSWIIMYMGTTLNIQWRANVFTHLLRLPVQYFEKRHMGDVVSRLHAIDHIQKALTTSFLEVILDGFMVVVITTMMFIYSPVLGLISTIAVGFYWISRWIWYRPLRSATEEEIVHAAKQQSHLLETIRGIKTIKLFQRQDERRSSWLALLVDQVNANVRTQKVDHVNKFLNGVLFGVSNILIVWLGARSAIEGSFTVGVLVAFITYKRLFDTRITALVDKGFEIKMIQLQGERLVDIMMHKPEALPEYFAEANESTTEASIQISGLRYKYAEHEPFVLDGIDMTVNAGESVAIVGPSGCGKSTLVNAMLGILPVNEGDILIGGISIKRIGVENLRRMIGTVMQDDVLFAGSVAENISFFDSHADQNWIEECARMAAIASDISAMPMGYHTFVGDMGTVLSGGQRQRILLARALYKRPKILFLDEATSHLDVRREAEVNNAVKSLQITRVIVAHRPETIASADRVIRLSHGKVHHDDSESRIVSNVS